MAEEAEEGKAPKKNWRKLIPIFITVLIITVLFTAEYLIRNSPPITQSEWYSTIIGLAIINMNIILILVLLVVIFRNIVKLLSERKQRILGSRFRTKLVFTMAGVTIVPTVLLYFIAADLIGKSIDRWYEQSVRDIVEASYDLSAGYLDDYKELVTSQSLKIAESITRENLLSADSQEYLWRRHLVPLLANLKIDVLDVYLGEDQLIPTLVDPDSKLLLYIEDPPKEKVREALRLMRNSEEKVIFWEERTREGMILRSAVPVYPREGSITRNKPLGVVVMGFGIKPSLTWNAEEIAADYRAYDEQVRTREGVKLSALTLLLIFMLISLFSAIWIGIYFSKGITVPIQQLAEGTRAIAAGNLDYHVDAASSDELGVLVESFNQMTKDLKQSKEELELANLDLKRSNLELERRRRYTATLLSNLSSAVISLGSDGTVTTINPSARELLALAGSGLIGSPWEKTLSEAYLEPLRALLSRFFESGVHSLGQELEIHTAPQILHLSARITSIRHEDGTLRGTLIVLEDLTQLVRAQRTAAWREVAQRIAHEIKNPLTPIQLSAERIRRKLSEGDGDGDPETRSVITVCTETIIEETRTLKSMVDAFSSFARMPPLQRVRTDINSVIERTVSIYRAEDNGFRVEKRLEPALPEIEIDPDQIKMAFVNIINNSIDAMDGRGVLEVTSSFDAGNKMVVVQFSDDGPGIPPEVKDKLFLPYFSTKRKGTGLGLAIVSRIISDHGGTISVTDNSPHGSRFIIELPLPV